MAVAALSPTRNHELLPDRAADVAADGRVDAAPLQFPRQPLHPGRRAAPELAHNHPLHGADMAG